MRCSSGRRVSLSDVETAVMAVREGMDGSREAERVEI